MNLTIDVGSILNQGLHIPWPWFLAEEMLIGNFMLREFNDEFEGQLAVYCSSPKVQSHNLPY